MESSFFLAFLSIYMVAFVVEVHICLSGDGTGHGRSVTLLCALLVKLGVCDTWQNAESFVKSTRPLARLNEGQKISLVEWTANFHVKPGKDQGDNDYLNVQLHDFASENGASLIDNSKHE